jgi:peptide/nickel transport system substrate-binding protein
MASPDDFGGGKLNLGGYFNPQVDALLREANGETALARRAALMVEAQRLHQQEVGHIPLYQQWQSWGAREGLQLVQTPEGGMPWREIVVSSARNGHK